MSLKKETVETRLDNIEEILKMLLVSSVLGSSDVDKIQENIISQFREMSIAFCKFFQKNSNYFSDGFIALFLRIFQHGFCLIRAGKLVKQHLL